MDVWKVNDIRYCPKYGFVDETWELFSIRIIKVC